MDANPEWLNASRYGAAAVDWLNPAVIAACIAIAGTIVGYWVQKRYEAEAINKAVLAEISRLLAVLKSHEDFWRKRVEAHDTRHVLVPFTHLVYTTQVKNIGVLKGELVADVVQFYGYVDFLNGMQAARKDYIAAEKSNDFDRLYLKGLQHCIHLGDRAFTEQFTRMKIPTVVF